MPASTSSGAAAGTPRGGDSADPAAGGAAAAQADGTAPAVPASAAAGHVEPAAAAGTSPAAGTPAVAPPPEAPTAATGRRLKRPHPGAERDWVVYVPKGRTPAVCATCLAAVLPRTPRVRLGARSSRCHHVGCTDLDEEAVARCGGWEVLTEADQGAVKKRLREARAALNSCPVQAAQELPQCDDSMIGAAAPDKAGELPTQVRNLEYWAGVPWERLHDGFHTGAAVPPQVHYAVTELRAGIACSIQAAGEAGDVGRETLGWKALIFLDALLFAAPRRRGGRRGQQTESLTKMLARRVRMAWAGEWAALWTEAQQSVHTPGTGYSRKQAQLLEADLREIERSIADGDDRSALRRVDGPMKMATSQIATRELPKLFPRAQQPLPPPQHVEPSKEDVAAFLGELGAAFVHAPRRKGPGPGGGRGEHWHFCPGFTDLWAPLRYCMLQLACGRVPDGVMAAVSSARVLAGDKGGEEVRPFALGIILRRHISRAVSRVFRDRAAKQLEPLQYGAGRAAGAELMHKTVLCDLAARPDACLDSFDVSNAHNEIERAAVIAATRRRIPELAPWVEPWLRTATAHVCILPGAPPVVLTKDRGGDQGDALINLLFPLTYQDVLEKTQEAARTRDPDARVYGYQDDADLVSKPCAREAASTAYAAKCAEIGLRPNESKHKVYFGPAAVRPTTVVQEVVERPVVLRHGGFDPIPVTADTDGSAETQLRAGAPEAKALHERRQVFIERLRQLMAAGLPKQLALYLLKVRTAGDATFVARACGLHPKDAVALDVLTRSFVESLPRPAGWTHMAARRCYHQWSESGLGLTSMELTAPAAAASWHTTAAAVAARLECASVPALCALAPYVQARLQSVQSWVRDATAEPTAAAGEGARAGVTQRDLMRARQAEEVEACRRELEDDPLATSVTHSCGGTAAAAWLARPRKPEHYFSDAQFEVALQLRLDLGVDQGDGVCKHRKKDGSFCGARLDRRGQHAMSCQCGGWCGRRHDQVRDKVVTFSVEHGGAAWA